MRIDTQVHVVSPDRERYPLGPFAKDSPPWFDSAVTGEELLAEMDAVGVDRAVLVQARSAYGYDNRYVVDAATAHPDRYASSCIVDLEVDPVSAIRHWVSDCGTRAIRLLFLPLTDGWLDSPACDRVFDELADLSVIAQAVVAAHQLTSLLAAARRHLEVPILLDHCGFSSYSGGPGYPEAQALFRLADAANAHVKLSTQVFEQARHDGATPRGVTEAVVAAYGATRVMWASDLTIHGGPYADRVAEAEAACAGLSDADRQQVMGGAAASMWWPGA